MPNLDLLKRALPYLEHRRDYLKTIGRDARRGDTAKAEAARELAQLVTLCKDVRRTLRESR